jgi:5-methylcytosine-specific restriction protein A
MFSNRRLQGKEIMPKKPAKPCPRPGCRHLQPCPIHPVKPWARNNPVERKRGRTLQRERDRLFNEFPLCVICLKKGIDRAATIRDHIVPLMEGGEDIESNTQGICRECHSVKSQEEAKRGRNRT